VCILSKTRKNSTLTELIRILSCLCCSIGKHDVFGEDVKKWYFDQESVQGKSNYSVRAMSYCDLHMITIADLQDIMDSYPEFAGGFLQNFTVTFNLRQVGTLMNNWSWSLLEFIKICFSIDIVYWYILLQ